MMVNWGSLICIISELIIHQLVVSAKLNKDVLLLKYTVNQEMFEVK